MKTSTNQAGKFWPKISRIALALTLVSGVGVLSIAPAFGDNDRDHDRGRRDFRGDHRGDHRGDRNWPGHRPGYYPHPYYYSAPVYAPAPVYYPPHPSPGVSLFFPLDVRIR